MTADEAIRIWVRGCEIERRNHAMGVANALVEEVRALRTRVESIEQAHAESVEEAYREGYLTAEVLGQDRSNAEDAWLDSDAKTRLEGR